MPRTHSRAAVMHLQILLGASIALFAANRAGAIDQEVAPPTEAAEIRTIIDTIEGGISEAYALGMRPSAEHFTMHGRASLIKCPTLITQAEGDGLGSDAEAFFGALVAERR